MKKYLPYSLILAAAATGLAHGAATAYTTPVGYVSHTIANQAGAPALTVISPPLVESSLFAGQSSSSPSASKTVSFAGATVPTGLGTTYVLEITSGVQAGWWSTVTSSTASTVTVNDAFPAGLSANTPVSVRKHTTILSFLGRNKPGLTPVGGAQIPDEVQILNSSLPGQPITSIVYVPATITSLPDDNWFDQATSQLANDVIIEPGSAILIKQNQASNLVFQSSGTVKVTPTQYDIYPGLNLVATQSAAGSSLNGMLFNTSLVQLTGSNADFDEFQTLNPDQTITQYAALAPGVLTSGATMANLATSTDAGTVAFVQGTGAIIKRDGAGSQSIITLPATVVSP